MVLSLAVFGSWVGAVLFLQVHVADLPSALGFLPLLSSFLVAVIIFWRKSNDLMALLVSLMLVFLEPYLMSGLSNLWLVQPGWSYLTSALTTVGVCVCVLCFYLFPNGQFAPRWMQGVALISLGILLCAGLADALIPSSFPYIAQVFAIVAPFCLLSQAYRYWRISTPLQRQQTKWVIVGLVGTILGFLIWVVSLVGGWDIYLNQNDALSLALNVFFAILPISIAFSILRYRLWDIDLILRRTLVYSLLTGLLAFIYFGSVVVLQNVFTNLTGQQSAIAIVISTLTIAALFVPLRNTVQRFIDRRFYRSNYDSAKALAAFSAAIRDETDLEVLSTKLVRVVDTTMQPETIDIWLNESTPASSNPSPAKTR
jgi:hypothetical protein